jgi:hypothetical protein
VPNLPEELPDDFIPALPEAAHIACIDPIWYRSLPKSGKAPISGYPTSPAKRRLEMLLSQVASVADVDDPVVVRVVVAGSDRVLHSALCGYLLLLSEEPQLFEGVDLRWYVVPFDDNLLSSFIARHDGWYKSVFHCSEVGIVLTWFAIADTFSRHFGRVPFSYHS